MRAALLVELLTEELPPKSLRMLSEVFAERLLNDLIKYQLKLRDPRGMRVYATPRRFAVLVPEVESEAPDREQEITGPLATAPAQAIAGFAKKQGLTADQLGRQSTPKGDVVVARIHIKGAVLENVLPKLIEDALKALPVAKLMRWGAGDAQFVRPVHGLVLLHGSRVVPASVLGIASGRITAGHRFLGERTLSLHDAGDYEPILKERGKVIAGFAARRAEIDRQLKEAAAREGASLGGYADLLDEVTALVEYPQVYAGRFEAAFLEVPQECLILTMRQNQKYFPLFAHDGQLRERFLIVSNMRADDPRHIIAGNERVVRPRLDDARFFYNQDRKQPLEARVPQLAKVVYHAKLGTLLERVERLQLIAGRIASALGGDVAGTERAAWLAKADHLTGMVGEFPELQGIMGRYYALHDGEPRAVAQAIEEHYLPRFAGDRLPESPSGAALALADKLETLAGFFGIRVLPTGERDPFGLRRAALGVIRILVERKLALSLADLVHQAFSAFSGMRQVADAHTDLETFLFERARGYFRDGGFSAHEVESVLSMNPVRFDLIPSQLHAVRSFAVLPEAESLAAANKRVVNILKQADARGESFHRADLSALKEPAERALFDALHRTAQQARSLFERGDYTGYLKSFAVLKEPVDTFFDSVMVMVDDEGLRRNRLALLRDLREAMNRIADLSKLAA